MHYKRMVCIMDIYIKGWNITKNLCAEITILSFIFLLGTIESSVHEFCHLSLMGLISDFFLQISFFVPVLSMDMNQLELSDSVKKPVRNRKMFQKPISGLYFFLSIYRIKFCKNCNLPFTVRSPLKQYISKIESFISHP